MRASSRLCKLILHCKATMARDVEYNFIYARCFGCQSAITTIKNNWHRVSCFPINKSNGHYRLIGTHASSDEKDSTDEVINQMLATIDNPEACKKICSNHLNNLCKDGNVCAATRLLQFLRDKKIFLSPAAYNRVLAVAAEKNDSDLSLQVFKDLLVSRRVISSTCFLNLARSFASTTDSVHLLRFVKEVSELAFPSGTTVVNRIILAFAECGQIENGLLIFDQMKPLKCIPDLITYNTILDILGRNGRIHETQHEFTSMKEAGIDPDFVTYNTLINSFRKVGRLDMCLVFLREMCENGIKPDLLTFTALIEAFGRSGNIEEALKLFDEMKQRKIKPSMQSYRSVISNLKKMGKVELAIKYVDEMNSSLSDLAGPEDFKSKERLLRNRKSRQ